jgi:hypothetical protein
MESADLNFKEKGGRASEFWLGVLARARRFNNSNRPATINNFLLAHFRGVCRM